jgi:histidyl-tRNA synthetase
MSKQKIPRAIMGMKEVHELWPLYSHVIDTSRLVLESKFGFNAIMPNIVESELTFNKTLGLQSDIVLKEMYQVTTSHPDAADSKGLVLRPEGTAGVLRYAL